jgi:hypothetical protein
MDSYYSLNDTLGYNSEYYSKSIDWSNYTYIYGYRYLYFYNPSHQPSQYQHFDLDTATSAWILSAHRLFTYDGNGNNIEELDQSYNGSIYENEFKMDHFYSFTTGIGTKPGPGSMCYYANPLPKGQPIQCKNLQSAKDYRFTLYSISGQLVFTTNIHDGEPLILPQTLSEGVYLMQVYGNEKMVAQGKIILIN